VQFEKFSVVLKVVPEKYNFTSRSIYNLGDSGLRNKLCKVISPKPQDP
jgi:hypothetical protein